MKQFNFLKGRYGETLVEKYLIKKGYKIICKNFSTSIAETDIIAKKDDVLVFIEVKTRKNCNYGSPSEAINYNKIHRLRNNAKLFLSNSKEDFNGIRFDVVEVILDDKSINQIEGAF